MFHQYARHCDQHNSCTVISCVTDADIYGADDRSTGASAIVHAARTEIWTSHLDTAIHVEHRVNPAVPAVDLRADGASITPSPVCDACAAHPAWPA